MDEFIGCITRKANSDNIVIEAVSNDREIKIIFTPENFAFALTAAPRRCEVIERSFNKKE
ncbi:hypothetical protein [Pelosinus baikalensis]|uniref:Uncharacterized protein n=1 Tax=Pelosinus baikalensis TaxID=2892015 RepID=A0ABS8HXX3_9FIRM|nr:hypothetical protein [Pelosinus baikalensis]MCC5468021.1 hypothetical protein [Pelosinus baikalensis]